MFFFNDQLKWNRKYKSNWVDSLYSSDFLSEIMSSLTIVGITLASHRNHLELHRNYIEIVLGIHLNSSWLANSLWNCTQILRLPATYNHTTIALRFHWTRSVIIQQWSTSSANWSNHLPTDCYSWTSQPICKWRSRPTSPPWARDRLGEHICGSWLSRFCLPSLSSCLILFFFCTFSLPYQLWSSIF